MVSATPMIIDCPLSSLRNRMRFAHSTPPSAANGRDCVLRASATLLHVIRRLTGTSHPPHRVVPFDYLQYMWRKARCTTSQPIPSATCRALRACLLGHLLHKYPSLSYCPRPKGFPVLQLSATRQKDVLTYTFSKRRQLGANAPGCVVPMSLFLYIAFVAEVLPSYLLV